MATKGEMLMLLIDVGDNMKLDANVDGETYAQLTKQCLEWIIQRKVTSTLLLVY
jgi:hypothetical protein